MKDTVTTWNVTAYVRSEMPLTSRVSPVFALDMVFIGDNPPSDAVVEAMVMSHMRNVVLLVAQVEESEVSRDLLDFE